MQDIDFTVDLKKLSFAYMDVGVRATQEPKPTLVVKRVFLKFAVESRACAMCRYEATDSGLK